MKNYKIELRRTIAATMNIMAPTEEAARNVADLMDPPLKDWKVEERDSKVISYEDGIALSITHLQDFIQAEEEDLEKRRIEGEDPEQIAFVVQDIDGYKAVLTLIEARKWPEALAQARGLDTFQRGGIPDSVWALLYACQETPTN